MYIRCDFSFMELQDAVWSGAVDTLKHIADAGLEDELMQYMEDIWYGGEPTITEVNDWLWFDSDSIYEAMGLDEDGNPPSDEEEEDEEDEDE